VRALVVVAMLAGSARADPAAVSLPDFTVEARLVAGSDARSLSLSPDVWIGLTPRLTVGIVHSSEALDRVEPGASVCVVTDELGCTRRYHGGGLDARYAVSDWLAPRARLLLRDTSPFKPAATVGALARWDHGRVAVEGDPYLQLGLANTDRGNRAALVLPLYVGYGPVWLETGYVSDLAVYRDGYHVPLAAGFRLVLRDVALSFGGGFTSLLGPQNNVKQRELFVALTTRWQR
jgi:hypothetical protein